MARQALPSTTTTRKTTGSPPQYRDDWEPFPLDLLPSRLQEFIRTVARAMSCDESFVALPVLVACAAAIGNSRCIELKPGWREPAIIWAAIVGGSGTTKTPALRAAVKPLQLREEALRESDRRFVVQDATIAALAPLLEENPRGLCLIQDELAWWMKAATNHLQRWLSIHSAEPLTIDRKTGKRPTIRVPRPCLSLIGGIQPEILTKSLGLEHRSSGMAARLLFALPPRRLKRWTDEAVAAEVDAQYAELINALCDLDEDENSDAWTPMVVKLDNDARDAFRSFYDEHAAEETALGEDLRAAWAKIHGYAGRLALVIHLVQEVTGEDVGATIGRKTMEAAVGLARWFRQQAQRVHELIGDTENSETNTAAPGILSLIEKNGGRITANELRRKSRRFKETADAKRALNELVDAGYGAWQETPPGRRGPKTQHFVLQSVSVSGIHDSRAGNDATSEPEAGSDPKNELPITETNQEAETEMVCMGAEADPSSAPIAGECGGGKSLVPEVFPDRAALEAALLARGFGSDSQGS